MRAREETSERGDRAPTEGQSGRSLPKTEPLRGSLHAELKRCSKPSCRCARGDLHGPYWSLRWREGNRQHHRYVRPAEITTVRTALAAWRALHPPARSTRDQLVELRRSLHRLDGLESWP
jgi:uncharacterized protein DUF6788